MMAFRPPDLHPIRMNPPRPSPAITFAVCNCPRLPLSGIGQFPGGILKQFRPHADLNSAGEGPRQGTASGTRLSHGR